jgi:phosphomevalonate kinase
VELRADGGFYSEGSPEVVDDAAAPTGKRVQVNKTGMGSSACLTASLVGALLSFLATPLPPGALLNLSQLAHCASQGKVGSGFDVAAAVSGGQLYTRFPREVLEVAGPLEGGVGRLAWVAEGRGAIVAGAYQPEAPAGAPPLWGAGAAPQQPFSLRELGLRLYLADVRGGSDSPSMARAVLEWREASAENGEHWEELGRANAAVLELLQKRDFGGAKRRHGEVRRLLREMGEGAGVPVEPPAQTALCDATAAVEGVVLAGVPGAGGVDAAFAVCVAGDDVRDRVDEVWEAFGGGGRVRRIRGVAEGEGGFRVEEVKDDGS